MVIMHGIGVEEGRGAGKGEAELQLGSWGVWEHDLHHGASLPPSKGQPSVPFSHVSR